MNTNNNSAHPGPYVRGKLPAELPVKEVAKRLGVGRPALSNFLNAKASLSREMAGRLAATFKLDADELLQMQAAYDAARFATPHSAAHAEEPSLPRYSHHPIGVHYRNGAIPWLCARHLPGHDGGPHRPVGAPHHQRSGGRHFRVGGHHR